MDDAHPYVTSDVLEAERAHVRERIAAERAELVTTLKHQEAWVKKAEKRLRDADKKVPPLDKEEWTDKETAAFDAAHEANTVALKAHDAVAATKKRIKVLDDPATFDSRVAARERIIEVRARYGPNSKEGNAMAGAATKTSLSKEDRLKIYKQVVDAVNATGSFSLAADKLNEDKVPMLGKSQFGKWTHDTVRSTAFRAMRQHEMKFTVKKQPRATKDKAPGEVVQLPSTKRSTAKRTGAKRQQAAAASSTSDASTSTKRSGSKRSGKSSGAKRSSSKR